MSSTRVPPIFNSVRRSIVVSGLKLSTSSMLKRSPKNGVLKTPGAAALRAISSPEMSHVIRTNGGFKAQKILWPANVIPVGVRDENGRQFGQVGRVRSQCFEGGLSRVRARARIDTDQFLPILRHHEIVFRELETGQ